MNRVAKIAIASALSSLALAGVSRAASLGMNTTAGIDQTLRHFHGTDFNVQQFYARNSENPDTYGPRSAPPRSAQDLRGIQASIGANKMLARELASKGVNVHDVVNVEQAADGSITFYTE
jgi:hypothetical protein